ncbi:MAG: hypothetical protein ABJB86_07160 [Bacteroidota bacterium]
MRKIVTWKTQSKQFHYQAGYQSNKKDHQFYMKYFTLFEKRSHKLKDGFEEIATLQNLQLQNRVSKKIINV